MDKKHTLTMSAAILLTAGAQVNAAVIAPVSASDGGNTIGGSRTITSAVNGSDLFNDSDKSVFAGVLTEANISTVVAGAATTFFGTDGYWLSSNGGAGSATLTFDLGGTFDVGGIYLWNYNRDGANNTRAIQTFDIAFSTDGGSNYSSAVTAASLGVTDFTQSPSTGGSGAEAYVPVQQRDFNSTQSGVTHVQITDITNYGNGAFDGLAEIRFRSVTTPIPEPSTATLLLGLGGVALLRRRR